MQNKVISFLLCLFLVSSAAFAEDKNEIKVADLKGVIEEQQPIEGLNEELLLKGSVENRAEFHILNDFQFNINDVRGPGQASSSYNNGVMYLENMNIHGKGNLGKLDYQFNLGGRATNDNRIDERAMTFTSIKGTATYEDHTVSAGDVFEYFSQYSLSTALKGASYKYVNTEDDNPDVTVVYGFTYPRWESFVNAQGTRAMERMGYGANLKHDLTPNLTGGVSFVRTTDDNRQFATETLFNNNVYSADFEYRPIKGLTVRGESAYSHGDRQLLADTKFASYFGHAQRIEAIGIGGPSKVDMEYEYVSPKFQSLLGSAAQNRQKAKINWRYKKSRNVTYRTGFMWYCNSLDKRLLRTHTYKPEVAVELRKPFDRRYAVLDLSLKADVRNAPTNHSFDHFTTLNYRDRFGKYNVDNSFGFTSYNTTNTTRESYEYNYHTSVNSRYKVGGVVLKPSINAGTYFMEDEIVNQLDKIVEYSLGLGVDIPKYKLTSNIKFGQNILNTGVANGNSDKLFSNISVYYKPSFVGFLNHSTFYLRLALNDFNFQNRTRNFSERIISMGMNIPVDLFVNKKEAESL